MVGGEDSAYVVERSNWGYWGEPERLEPTDGGRLLGSVSIDGDSIVAGAEDGAYVFRRNNPGSDWPMGYGYQWWIPENPEGDFSAIGIYGQFIYVHPTHRVVIAKSSAYVDYNNTGDEMEFESMEAFRAIARGF